MKFLNITLQPTYANDHSGNPWVQVQVKLAESLAKKQGSHYGDLCRMLTPAPPNQRSYQKVLQDFLQTSLQEKQSLVDIDPMWYHFGLDYLGNVPLIEPSEEAQRPRQGTLVVAIDTSGSCDGEVCQQFLRELCNLMDSLSVMDSLRRITLLQCDSIIQEELHLDDPEQWEEAMNTFQPKGFGGTDFCPVFQRAEALEDVVGLIYFTDGYGTFPQHAPDFPHLILLSELSDDASFSHYPDWVNFLDFSCIS